MTSFCELSAHTEMSTPGAFFDTKWPFPLWSQRENVCLSRLKICLKAFQNHWLLGVGLITSCCLRIELRFFPHRGGSKTGLESGGTSSLSLKVPLLTTDLKSMWCCVPSTFVPVPNLLFASISQSCSFHYGNVPTKCWDIRYVIWIGGYSMFPSIRTLRTKTQFFRRPS